MRQFQEVPMRPRMSSPAFGFSIPGLIIFSLLVTAVPARGQSIDCIRQFGTNRQDQGLAVGKGPSGEYGVGSAFGIFSAQTNAGDGDMTGFVTRYDEQGNTLWTRQFGNTTLGQVEARGVTTDQTGVYVVGG